MVLNGEQAKTKVNIHSKKISELERKVKELENEINYSYYTDVVFTVVIVYTNWDRIKAKWNEIKS